jgi:dGTPase
LGATIARALAAYEDLVEVISLAHDLGHPPFGHCGEAVLNELMADEGGFDHNKQSLRIVTTLERRYPDFPGLNLTWEVREGIVKHETEYDISDATDYDPHLRGFLEAQITNIADELAYIAHDLDDGLRAKMITPLDLKDLAVWQVLLDQLQIRQTPFPLDDLSRHRIVRRLIGLEVTDVLNQAEKRLNQSNVQSVLALQSLPYPIIEFSETFIQYNRELKDFLFQRLYRHHHVNRTAVKSERIIKALFETYLQEPGILPPHIIAQAEKQSLKRVICDYIAGMTDRFAIQEYQRIFDPLTRA